MCASRVGNLLRKICFIRALHYILWKIVRYSFLSFCVFSQPCWSTFKWFISLHLCCQRVGFLVLLFSEIVCFSDISSLLLWFCLYSKRSESLVFAQIWVPIWILYIQMTEWSWCFKSKKCLFTVLNRALKAPKANGGVRLSTFDRIELGFCRQLQTLMY